VDDVWGCAHDVSAQRPYVDGLLGFRHRACSPWDMPKFSSTAQAQSSLSTFSRSTAHSSKGGEGLLSKSTALIGHDERDIPAILDRNPSTSVFSPNRASAQNAS